MNYKMFAIIGSVVAAIAGGAALAVTYTRFNNAQKALGSSTLGDLIAAKEAPEEIEEEPQEAETNDDLPQIQVAEPEETTEGE